MDLFLTSQETSLSSKYFPWSIITVIWRKKKFWSFLRLKQHFPCSLILVNVEDTNVKELPTSWVWCFGLCKQTLWYYQQFTMQTSLNYPSITRIGSVWLRRPLFAISPTTSPPPCNQHSYSCQIGLFFFKRNVVTSL